MGDRKADRKIDRYVDLVIEILVYRSYSDKEKDMDRNIDKIYRAEKRESNKKIERLYLPIFCLESVGLLPQQPPRGLQPSQSHGRVQG